MPPRSLSVSASLSLPLSPLTSYNVFYAVGLTDLSLRVSGFCVKQQEGFRYLKVLKKHMCFLGFQWINFCI